MTTRSNEHLEKAYQSGHATNHHEGLRAVYQLGRTDEAAALAPKQEIEAEPELTSSPHSPPEAETQVTAEVSSSRPSAEQEQAQPEGQTPPAEAEPTPAS